ncbi:MAG: endonuclease, partial [Candidatus Electrothrix sp. ATG1]|nr:endonuclease [Candidatus Electrothrix sp. ATG1]
MSKYDKVIERVFFENYKSGLVQVSFAREELAQSCDDLKIKRIKNLGDIPYSYRFRKELPKSIKETAPEGTEWIIIGTGIGTYEFRQASPGKIEPTKNRQRIKVPDATPEIVKHYAPGTDEQALLTRVRYNRLVDIFSGLTCYSIQNHL